MHDQLGQLGLSGMAQAFAELRSPMPTGSASCSTVSSPIVATPTYADAILDRLVHNAHHIDLAGDSLRRRRSRPTPKD
jgi:DNA replication protein DnaC